MASSTAGTLAVNVIANTAKFAAGMKTGVKGLDKFRKSVGNATKFVAKLGTALSATAVAGLAAFTKGQLEAVDEIAKTSRALGVGIERWQSFIHAGKLAGVEADTLKTAFVRMNVNISDAADGVGDAKEAFAKLGIDVKQLKQLSPEQAMFKLAASINKVADSKEKIQVLTDIFGRGGAPMANFVAGLKGATDEFDAMGTAINAADAARIEQFNDALTKLKELGTSVGRELVIAVVPAALDALKSIEEVIEGIRLLRAGKGQQPTAEDFRRRQGGIDVPGLFNPLKVGKEYSRQLKSGAGILGGLGGIVYEAVANSANQALDVVGVGGQAQLTDASRKALGMESETSSNSKPVVVKESTKSEQLREKQAAEAQKKRQAVVDKLEELKATQIELNSGVLQASF